MDYFKYVAILTVTLVIVRFVYIFAQKAQPKKTDKPLKFCNNIVDIKKMRDE